MMTIEERMQLAVAAKEKRFKNLKQGDVRPESTTSQVREGVDEVAGKIADKAGINRSSVYRYHAVQNAPYQKSEGWLIRENSE
jgi:AcrR family transcriptional regulator